ncbi:MAG TPA: GspH/FimT family pseudopilin [Caulifigura sp.]|nr:GspH/FimT family pseudopilin [Caulifigura sp.]
MAVLIMGILAASAVPRFAEALTNARVTTAAQRIAADLRYLRCQAITSSATQQVTFVVAQNRYTLVNVKSIDRPTVDYSVDLDDLFGAWLQSATLGGNGILKFDMHGQPDSGGTITISCGSSTRTITVRAITGETTIN